MVEISKEQEMIDAMLEEDYINQFVDVIVKATGDRLYLAEQIFQKSLNEVQSRMKKLDPLSQFDLPDLEGE